MANTKISDLAAVTTPAFTDLFAGVQGGVNFKFTITQIMAPHVAAADPHPGYVLESAAGTMHTQAASAVAITGGTITGITDLAVADGGTGAGTASGARTNLGLVIGTDVQAHSAVLDATTASFLTADETKLDGIEALADVTDATNVAAAGAVMEADTTTAAMQFVIDEDNMASNLATKVPTQQSVKAYVDAAAGVTTLDGLSDVVITTPTTGQVVKYDGANWINDTDATGGGGGALNDLTDVTITAAATGDILRYNGTAWVDFADSAYAAAVHDHDADYQPLDADLTTLSTAFTTASASGPASLALAEDTDNGANTVTIIAPATVATNKTVTLQDVTGTVYVSGGTDVAVADGGTGASDASGARTNLGLVIGTNVQAFDADLTTIAGLTPTTNNFLAASGSAWASRTPTQAIAHLGLDADIATLALPASTTISTFGASLVDDADAAAGRTTLAAAPLYPTLNAQTGTTYTLVLTDDSKLVTLSNAAAITMTVPPNSSVAFPTGTRIDLAQIGAGQVTVAQGAGVTVNATPGLKMRAQYSGGTLVKTGTDTWLLFGDLAA